MQCSKCEFKNKEGAKFCAECGSKLSLKCPSCGSDVETGEKFCTECGTKLGSSGPDLSPLEEKIDKIQRYLPQGLTDKILAQKDRIEGERKIVTVLFCDLVGYTAMASKLDPEDTYNLMDQVLEILIHKVHDYGGTVNQLLGDGLYALFGAPVALEDGPQRAIRSAMDMHKELTKFSEKITKEKDIPPLRLRIGINTGPVVMGTIGNSLRVDFTAMGDTVNLASRMEGLAEPGTIYTTEETFNLTEHFFRFEALGGKEVKGFDAPIPVYRVIDRTSRSTRFDVSAERGLTPLVGRERELEILLDGFEMVKSGRGQAFSIVAEAGTGKSRLLYEVRKAVANEDVTILEGKCLSYGKNTPYLPIIDIIKAKFRIEDKDRDNRIKEKITDGLSTLQLDENTILPYLLNLLSVTSSEIASIPTSAEEKQERYIEYLKQVVLKESESRPLIVIIEDLHWMDKSSEEVLKYLLNSISGARILLVFTYRPEFVHTWGGRSYHNQVNLNRLSNRESLTMVRYLLNTEELESGLNDLILEKTEGVPFFIEEFIKSLIDLKAIEKKNDRYCVRKDIKDLTIPSTVQDVIMTRVDSLPDGAKALLQAGAAVEREFSYELLRRIVDLPENEHLSNISMLKNSELLFERGIFPESTLIFKHAVTREVVYDSILSGRKGKLHEDIGSAIEELYGDDIKEYYGILAEHFLAGQNYLKGAEYCQLAMRKAANAVSFSEAIAHAEKWVDCLEKLPRSKDMDRKIIDARTTLGQYFVQMALFAESKTAIAPIVDLAIKNDYRRRIAQIYTILGTHSYFIEGDLPTATNYLEKAIKLAEETQNIGSLLWANHYIGHVFSDRCEFEKGHYHIEKALEIPKMGNVLWGIAMHKACIAFNVFYVQGKIDLAYETGAEGLRLAEESGDMLAKSEAYTNYGICCYGKGFLDEAEDCLQAGLKFSIKSHFISMESNAYTYLGIVYHSKKDYLKAKNYFSNSISILKKSNWLLSYSYPVELRLVRTQLMNKEGISDMEMLYSYAALTKAKRYEGQSRRILGDICKRAQ